MLDAKFIYSNIDLVLQKLATRNGVNFDAKEFVRLFEEVRRRRLEVEVLKADKNRLSSLVGIDDFVRKENYKKSVSLGIELGKLEPELKILEEKLENLLLYLPNLPLDDMPVGKDETQNREVRREGEQQKFDFPIKDHVQLGEKLQQMDFEFASRLAGSRFSVLRGDLARLHRGLIQFMLTQHQKRGYEELYVPQLVNAESLQNTGQLPKFKEDIFAVEDGKWYLIPTAEVPLTNLVAGKVLDESSLPLKLTAHTSCFRSEAGSYGKDTKGMIRQHQFDKVELVHITTQEDGLSSLENMLEAAENILQLLKLPYRVVLLCTGDMGFASAKTYDIEVWLPSQNTYREISSCSLCTDFQARRMKARYKDSKGNKKLVHTLNGSGLAIGRTMVAILENYQNADGAIRVPEVLRDFMGKDIIS